MWVVTLIHQLIHLIQFFHRMVLDWVFNEIFNGWGF